MLEPGAAFRQPLRIKLVGTKSNRDGIGSVIWVQSDTNSQKQILRSGLSYLSSSELVRTFGFGTSTEAKDLPTRGKEYLFHRFGEAKSNNERNPVSHDFS